MNRTELIQLHTDICEKARSIMLAKNNDYTGGSDDIFKNFRGTERRGIPAEKGVLVRLDDKTARIDTFIDKGVLQVPGESVEDAIVDSINYLVILLGIITERKEQEAA